MVDRPEGTAHCPYSQPHRQRRSEGRVCQAGRLTPAPTTEPPCPNSTAQELGLYNIELSSRAASRKNLVHAKANYAFVHSYRGLLQRFVMFTLTSFDAIKPGLYIRIPKQFYNAEACISEKSQVFFDCDRKELNSESLDMFFSIFQ